MKLSYVSPRKRPSENRVGNARLLRMMISSVLRKQNRSVQSLDTKLRVIGEIKEGSSQKFVADKYKVAKSTINL